MFLTGEFQDAESVAVAIEALKAKGIETSALDVFSTEPVEFAPGVLDRESRMSAGAVAGAVTLCLLSMGFVIYTQHDLRLVTGGMPLVSFWATGVIFYEMTMLGAIGATFVMLLWESGLLRRDKTAPVPAAEPGVIALRVQCEDEQVAAAGECLYRAGATRVEER